MEDRYLFKAKRVDNGEWVQGALLDGESHCIIGQEIKFSPYIEHECKIVGYEVDRNTICQCTGLRDKNGKLIWENDIVKFNIYNYDKLESNTISQIKWCNNLCALSLVVNDKGTRGTLGHLMELNKEVEVIGNIFDNPELSESEG